MINKDFRQEIPTDQKEVFYSWVSREDQIDDPFVSLGGVNFYYLFREQVYLVGASLENDSVVSKLSFLGRVEGLIRDFCGSVSEDSIRSNFILIYEILDQMVDFGYFQSNSTEEILHYIL